MEDRTPLIVVTDLDGTLLDHHSYSFEPALPALERLTKLRIPVVLNTSKTSAELSPLLRQLKLNHPYVVENGAAIYWPADYFPHQPHNFHELGASRPEIIGALKRIKFDFDPVLEGFSDWNVQQLMAHTGLDSNAAELALQRDFSEPLLWRSDEAELTRLRQRLADYGLELLKGGRFVHAIGRSDKGQALTWLADQYQQLWGQRPKVIALGDGQNDVAMLELADYPVLIKSPQNEAPTLSAAALNRCIIPDEEGPHGWNHALNRLISQLVFNEPERSSSKEQYHG